MTKKKAVNSCLFLLPELLIMRFHFCVSLFALSILFSCVDTVNEDVIVYPESKKSTHFDSYHGVEIPDPYNWLENDTASETLAWINDQNKTTFTYLDKIPYRNKIRERLDSLMNYPRQSAPVKAGNYYFYTANSGLQNQSVIYYKEGIGGQEEVFLDPNTFSEEGTISFSLAGFSENDSMVVLSKSSAGSDWQELIVYSISDKRALGDTLKWVKFSAATWYGNGFYYSRYPAPIEGEAFKKSNSNHSVYYHRIGENQEDDLLVYSDTANPKRYHSVRITEDKKYLILYIAEGTDGFECHFKSTSHKGGFTPLFTGFSHKSSIVDHVNGQFLVITNVDASNYKLVSVDPLRPAKENWVEIIPEGNHLLQNVSSSCGMLFAGYLENAQTKIYIMEQSGKNKKEISLPGAGSAHGFGGKKEDSVVYYSYSSFTFPGSVYSYNVKTGSSDLYYESKLLFDPLEYESKQVFYKSKDGTPVSMFIVHKKGIVLDGNNPCLLYGYGGFNISLTPGFSVARIPWLENGGVFAMPNLRGGGEYGEDWHKSGMLENKQNVFDDFISAAEYLIKEKYTTSGKLVISGRSNGGLLVGAVMAQRPDLMKVALPGVGVLDMLKYHKFTVGHGWIPEYGSSDDPAQFKNLFKYSPLHNLKKDVEYPACLIYTGDHDDRVVPAHSFKFAATLQEKAAGPNPRLIRIETKAGHGGGKPISKLMDEEADKLAFSFYNIGLTPYSEY